MPREPTVDGDVLLLPSMPRASSVAGVVCERWFLLRVMATVASWLQSPYSAAVPSIAVGSGSK